MYYFLKGIVDLCLKSFDKDNDGILQYHEYKKATEVINDIVEGEIAKNPK